jgi:hypothetical protein
MNSTKRITWYAAGRIGFEDVRFGLVPCYLPNPEVEALIPAMATPIPFNVGHHALFYSGPFTVSSNHGSANSSFRDNPDPNLFSAAREDQQKGFGSGSHGSGRIDCVYTGPEDTAGAVFKRAMDGIKKADCVFAWIADHQCYGTLVELGYARALGKRIYIAHSPIIEPVGELWFALRTAEEVGVYTDPKKAWVDAIATAERAARFNLGAI